MNKICEKIFSKTRSNFTVFEDCLENPYDKFSQYLLSRTNQKIFNEVYEIDVNEWEEPIVHVKRPTPRNILVH